jgi:hypothetical protein
MFALSSLQPSAVGSAHWSDGNTLSQQRLHDIRRTGRGYDIEHSKAIQSVAGKSTTRQQAGPASRQTTSFAVQRKSVGPRFAALQGQRQ